MQLAMGSHETRLVVMPGWHKFIDGITCSFLPRSHYQCIENPAASDPTRPLCSHSFLCCLALCSCCVTWAICVAVLVYTYVSHYRGQWAS